jgi:uncharacterized repeat protein (TIGR03837 family)
MADTRHAPQPAAAAPEQASRPHPALRWDVFCRVVDNFGDIGICWRLCADLAHRGHGVRLWVDDSSALAWMAPAGRPGLQVRHWTAQFPDIVPGDVVVEAFACDPPATFVAAMSRSQVAPVWINLEYLSSEGWVDRVHGLPSPQWNGPGAGLTKWFFHPGFTTATGGLLREPGLLRAREAFDAEAWRRTQGLTTAPGERLVTLFCYAQPALPALIAALGAAPTLLATAQGHATQQVRSLPLPRTVRKVALPWLNQIDFDHLLWSADLNFVRGEDTPVRAIWAGRPFVWQLYPQEDDAHRAKWRAFMDHWLTHSGAAPALAAPVTALWEQWNAPPLDGITLPETEAASEWAQASVRYRDWLAAQEDLTTQLLRFVAARRAGGERDRDAPETPAG